MFNTAGHYKSPSHVSHGSMRINDIFLHLGNVLVTSQTSDPHLFYSFVVSIKAYKPLEALRYFHITTSKGFGFNLSRAIHTLALIAALLSLLVRLFSALSSPLHSLSLLSTALLTNPTYHTSISLHSATHPSSFQQLNSPALFTCNPTSLILPCSLPLFAGTRINSHSVEENSPII